MARHVRRSARLLLGVLVAVACLAPAVEAKEPHPIIQWARKLAQPVDFPGFATDPKMTLQVALDFLAEKSGMRFYVTEAAFPPPAPEANAGVSSSPVATKPIPKMTRVRLATVLKAILARLSETPGLRGVTYVIRDDGIEITTEESKLQEFYRHGIPGDHALPTNQPALTNQPNQMDDPNADRFLHGIRVLPLVQAEFDKRALEDALKELADATDCTVVLDPRAADDKAKPVTATLLNVPLDTAVELLANMAGLRVVSRDRVLYVTTKENADAMQKELVERAFGLGGGMGGMGGGLGALGALGGMGGMGGGLGALGALGGMPGGFVGGGALGGGTLGALGGGMAGMAAPPDQAKTQAEIAKLQAEIAKLKAELARQHQPKGEPGKDKK